jgi:hypothetical protein
MLLNPANDWNEAKRLKPLMVSVSNQWNWLLHRCARRDQAKLAVGARHRLSLSVSVSPTEHILERLGTSEISETWDFPFQSDFELLNL